ncbi:hypothetical protein FACS189493_1410 [Spirochaetia bacterium]|nr:hypothetical protein FACS189493_1410 [Spirochaetia bacterium]
MNQSLLQALAGCTVTGKMQTLFAGARIGNAAKLAAALNPTAGIYAALRAMDPCRVLDAIGKRPSIKELVPELFGNISHTQTGVSQ